MSSLISEVLDSSITPDSIAMSINLAVHCSSAWNPNPTTQFVLKSFLQLLLMPKRICEVIREYTWMLLFAINGKTEMIGGYILLSLRATEERSQNQRVWWETKEHVPVWVSLYLFEIVCLWAQKNWCLCGRDLRKDSPFKNSSAESNRTLHNQIIFINYW